MDKAVPSNFLKSSNILFVSIGVSVVNFILRDGNLSERSHLYISLTSWLLIAGIGFLVRNGHNWVKYVLLLLAIINLYSISLILQVTNDRILTGILSIAPILLQIWATILLFIKPADPES